MDSRARKARYAGRKIDKQERHLRYELWKAAKALLEHTKGDTFAVEEEIAAAVSDHSGKFVYCDIHG
jgi:hypothetical protein